MTKLKRFKDNGSKRQLRVFRYFSEDFKRKKVKEIEQNLSSVSSVSKEYGVSDTAIYNWIHKYSTHMEKGVRQVVEAKSDTLKIQQLREQIKELECIVGQKQIVIDFQAKMIELAEQEYEIEIKKKFGSTPLSGSGQTGKNTHTR